MEENSGLGIFGPNCEISQGLGKCPSVFQAEVLAIDFCARSIVENGINGANKTYSVIGKVLRNRTFC